MPDPDPRPDERHQDLVSLSNAIHTAKRMVLGAILPPLLIGVWTLVANHFQQKQLIQQVTDMKQSMNSMGYRIDRLNEKVIVMWSAGNWKKRYGEPDSSEETSSNY